MKRDSVERAERDFVGGRYRLLAGDGRATLSGPLAEVFHVHDTASGCNVALKRFLPQVSQDARFAIRFREQLKQLATVQHPALVRVLDYGVDGDAFFIAGEWMDGINLHTYLAEYGAFSPEAAVHVARQICAALGALHEQGLIHRGLKPENIFLTADGQVKVADATLSTLASESGLSQTTVMMGAVDYMSPEQAWGKAVSPASDVYSLGVVLFEMLTDRLPFEASDSWSVVRMHAQAAPPSPRLHNHSVSPQLAAIVVKALDKSPQGRFASARALDAALAPLPQGDELLWLVTPRHAHGRPTRRLSLPFDVGAAAAKGAARVGDGVRKGRQALAARARQAETPQVVQDLAARHRRLPFAQRLLLQFMVTFLIAFMVLYLLSGAVANSGAQEAAAPEQGVSAEIDKYLPEQEPTPTLASTAAPTETPTAPAPTAVPAQAPVEAAPPAGSTNGNAGGGASNNGNQGGGPPPHAGPPGGPPGLSDGHPGRGRGGKP